MEVPPKAVCPVDLYDAFRHNNQFVIRINLCADIRIPGQGKAMMSFAPSCTALEIVQPGIAGLSIARENTSPTFSFIIMFF